MTTTIKRVLSIAGSDSGGGAGIQADLKTCSALGCYGMTVITAITAQNTVSVRSIHAIPPSEVVHQLEAVLEDIGVDAVKTGMLMSAEIIEAVATVLERYQPPNLVVDPVMISKSGARLLEDSAVDRLKERLLPLATLVTPNVPEASVLTGIALDPYTHVHDVLDALHALGPRCVLLKGGHFDSPEAVDYLYDGDVQKVYATKRINTNNTHGTGCTFAAAIACQLAQGHAVPEAIQRAKDYLTRAIAESDRLNIGKGVGPLHHGWNVTGHPARQA